MVLSDNNEMRLHYSNDGTDSSGQGNDATLNGSPSFTTDKNAVASQAIALNGSAQYVTAGYSLSGVSTWSISSWAVIGTTQGWNGIVATANQSSGDGFVLRVYHDGGTNFQLQLDIRVAGASTTLNDSSTISGYTPGDFFHYSITYNSGTWTLRINDTAIGSVVQAQTTHNTNCNFGRYYADNNTNILTGKYDESYMWSRVITGAEITTCFNDYDAAFPDAGYSNKVNGVVGSKIIGVDVADISKVNGV